jgi:hypothetical protein
VLARELLEEVIRQQKDVGLSFAQRRHEDREDVEAVIEIVAEFGGRNRLLEVLVRGGDEPDVRVDRLGAAEPLEFALLQDAQQLDLRREVEIADLVEKQRAAVRQLEPPFFGGMRARECPLLVAEQLRLDEILRQRRAAHLDERFLGAGGIVVNRVRDQLLAGA